MPDRIEGREVSLGPRRRQGIVRACDLSAKHEPFPYAAPYSQWNLGTPHAALFAGPPGGGKSTGATDMAVSASRSRQVLYIAIEEGLSAMLQERVHRVGLDDLSGRRLQISDARTATEIAEDVLAAKPDLVILDSVSDGQLSPEWVASLLAGKSWIGICHINARNLPIGSHTWAHAVDTVIWCEKGVATVRKNRFGGDCTPIQVYEVEQ